MIITVFDFDDTLFPTTHAHARENEDVDFSEISQSICNLLQHAYIYSDKVFIITNGNKPWINQAWDKLPHCAPIRDLLTFVCTPHKDYFSELPPHAIKTRAFHETIGAYFTESGMHDLLCFGDAPGDFLAGQAMQVSYPNVKVRNIALIPAPSMDMLLLQQKFIMEHFRTLIDMKERLELKLNIFGEKYSVVCKVGE